MNHNTIGLIHISDIHIVETIVDNVLLKRVEKIIDSLKNKLLGLDEIFLVVSGDVAFSGKINEYELAQKFIEELTSKLNSYSGKTIHIVGVPGNHDCNFDNNLKTRELILDGLESTGFRELDDDIIGQCCLPQENYFIFENDIFFTNSTKIYESNLLKIVEYKCCDTSVIFNCFNTAWTSRKKEHEGKLSFPTNYYESGLFNNDGAVRINIIHHPLNWQSSGSHRELRKFLNLHGDITLSGHEHTTDANSSVNSEGEANIFIESAALQDSNDKHKSSFNLNIINFNEGTLTTKSFRLSDGKYISRDLITDRKFTDKSIGRRISFNLSTAWSEHIESIGAQFLHRRSEKLFLDDLYVSPYLRKMATEGEKSIIINFSDVISEKKEIKKIIIVGESNSGKTTLCKRLYREYHSNGQIPILIRGEEILKTEISYIFNELLKSAFARQYNKPANDKYENIDKAKIAIIIDDFHTCELKDNFRKLFIQELNDNFKNIVITSNSLLYFNPLTDGDSNFSDYISYTILESSYEVRYQLIKKWNSLYESEIVGNDLVLKNEHYDNQIKEFLGKSYLPHFPFTILAALQSIDNSESSEHGFSYYFKYLIEAALKRHIKNNDDLQFYHYFLCEFCYFLFDEKVSTIQQDDFEKYFKSYVRGMKVSIEFRDAYNQLLLSKTLKIENNFIQVTYKYIYYYFVASYIANHIDQDDIKNLVRKLIERLFVDEYASIIIFLSQITSNPFVINSLREYVLKYYSDQKPAELGADIKEMDELISKLPELILENKNLDESTKKVIKNREDAENSEKALEDGLIYNQFDIDEDISNLSLLQTLIRSIKTFEIFGQVVKRNWGAYNGELKKVYVNDVYNLALRILSSYFSLIKDNNKGLIDYVYYVADKREISSKTEIERLAKALVFNFCYVTAFGIIKRVSNSISHYQLKETFTEIAKDRPTNAIKLITLSIMLDHLGQLPINDIRELYLKDKNFNKYYLTKLILRNFVYQYLHMYEVPHEERNQICAVVGITVDKQLQIHGGSKERK